MQVNGRKFSGLSNAAGSSEHRQEIGREGKGSGDYTRGRSLVCRGRNRRYYSMDNGDTLNDFMHGSDKIKKIDILENSLWLHF